MTVLLLLYRFSPVLKEEEYTKSFSESSLSLNQFWDGNKDGFLHCCAIEEEMIPHCGVETGISGTKSTGDWVAKSCWWEFDWYKLYKGWRSTETWEEWYSTHCLRTIESWMDIHNSEIHKDHTKRRSYRIFLLLGNFIIKVESNWRGLPVRGRAMVRTRPSILTSCVNNFNKEARNIMMTWYYIDGFCWKHLWTRLHIHDTNLSNKWSLLYYYSTANITTYGNVLVTKPYIIFSSLSRFQGRKTPAGTRCHKMPIKATRIYAVYSTNKISCIQY